MEYLFIFLAVAFIAYLLLFKTKNKIQETSVKKEQIILEYEKELQELLLKTDDPKEQAQIKNKFLQKCNSELSRNIFFTQEESKQALQKLASI
jgi:hypothetical protein